MIHMSWRSGAPHSRGRFRTVGVARVLAHLRGDVEDGQEVGDCARAVAERALRNGAPPHRPPLQRALPAAAGEHQRLAEVDHRLRV